MAGPMARTDWDRFCHKVDKNFWKDMNDWGKGVEKFFTDGPITPVFKPEFNGLKSSMRQELDQKAKESNGLREELLALKASKLEAEVKTLREAMKDMKDMNDMNVKDVKDLRHELMSLKALNETMICENKELTQELMSLNISQITYRTYFYFCYATVVSSSRHFTTCCGCDLGAGHLCPMTTHWYWPGLPITGPEPFECLLRQIIPHLFAYKTRIRDHEPHRSTQMAVRQAIK
ncbi:unnamed protein product [Oppiella nova]|uniref:Uncharacterized protein n=1 Tax=Oppiella nova TaxID=334625 RepID=A0A7R9LVK6_9ACAR|nr:unnamed protein product [Oppiella nova]CAG2167085.1 unnamed protein product [Oppiella nova]